MTEPEPELNTLQLHKWVDRMRGGDLGARDELLRAVGDRMERLARKMLDRYPSVKRWAESGDVLQESLLRLFRALQEVQPTSVKGFFGLAAEQMRRELLDLNRRYHGPLGLGANHDSVGSDFQNAANAAGAGQQGDSQDSIEKWAAFHEEVVSLSEEHRDVFNLIYYHGWTQSAVADALQISVRTVQRRWEAAAMELYQAIKKRGF